MSVNSVAVLRLMGKGGGAVPTGVTRGRGSARGGRGELTPSFFVFFFRLDVCKFSLRVPRPYTKPLSC